MPKNREGKDHGYVPKHVWTDAEPILTSPRSVRPQLPPDEPTTVLSEDSNPSCLQSKKQSLDK